MNTTNNTVLISGGTAGIGLEIAKLFAEKGNKVIITGRTKERLDKALKLLPKAIGFQCDITNEDDVNALVKKVKSEHKDLNILINSAGTAHVYNLTEEYINASAKAEDEMQTNYFSIIRLNEKLLSMLKSQKQAAIVNISSIVAIVPGALATYSASKAALHSYTQALRISLERSAPTVKVFELMPPLVDTEFSAPIGGHNGMPAPEVAGQFIENFEKDNFEIHVGQTKEIYNLFLSSPLEALKRINS